MARGLSIEEAPKSADSDQAAVIDLPGRDQVADVFEEPPAILGVQ